MKKIVLFSLLVAVLLSGCGKTSEVSNEEGNTVLNIAYQYGLAYAPAIIAQEQGLIEKAYEEATGKELTVVWTQMGSGADINTSIASGSIDVGFMGVAPAITGVTKGVGYKVFTNLSGQENCLMTTNTEVDSLDDLVGSNHQIVLVNSGSIQHIILAKALKEQGLEAHALDSNIVAMKHPDGMAALMSGNVAFHLTSSPYVYMERENSTIQEIKAVGEAWPREKSFIVGVASNRVHTSDEAAYLALCRGIEEAVELINDDVETAAAITHEFNGNTIEDEMVYLKNGNYTTKTSGIYELALFMAENGFVQTEINSYSDLVFDNVKGD